MAERTFFGTIRIALLLAVLAFVALGAWLDRRRSTDWDAPLRVTIYPIPAGEDATLRDHVAALAAEDFDDLAAFFASEAGEHGLALDEPLRVRVSHAATSPPPLPAVAMDDPLPTPDVQVFALYHPADGTTAAPDSLGLSKGLVAIAQIYADHDAHGSNQVVIAHELLHTLGATDKYDRATGQPLVPHGLGDPEQSPRFPQRLGEIMAGRIATGAGSAVIPESLEAMRVGPETAREIGWQR